MWTKIRHIINSIIIFLRCNFTPSNKKDSRLSNGGLITLDKSNCAYRVVNITFGYLNKIDSGTWKGGIQITG